MITRRTTRSLAPALVAAALFAAVVGSASATGGPGHPTGPGPHLDPGSLAVERETLGTRLVGDHAAELLLIERLTLPPTTALGPDDLAGAWVLTVEVGSLLAAVEARDVTTGGDPAERPLFDPVALTGGTVLPLVAGGHLAAGPGAAVTVRNAGETDAVVVVAQRIARPVKL